MTAETSTLATTPHSRSTQLVHSILLVEIINALLIIMKLDLLVKTLTGTVM